MIEEQQELRHRVMMPDDTKICYLVCVAAETRLVTVGSFADSESRSVTRSIPGRDQLGKSWLALTLDTPGTSLYGLMP
jgi:hypothetical protein